MDIGIIVAMDKELSLLKAALGIDALKTENGIDFFCGTIGTHRVVLMKCGIGKVNAAVGTTMLIDRFGVGLVINTGVAGGADASVNVMDTVAATQVAYHDVWCGPESTYGAVQGLPLYYTASKRVLGIIGQSPEVKLGLVCSGDQFVDSRAQLDAIKAHFPQALAVDMESGAIAQVCYLRNVPFACIRVISDSPYASNNNTQQYNDFWQEAPRHSFAIVEQILQNI